MKVDVNEAYRILVEARKALQALISANLEKHEHAEVAAMDRIAAKISSAIAILTQGLIEGPGGDDGEGTGQDESHSDGRGPSTVLPTYPRFERNGQKLVKVGWGRKTGEEYFHRTPWNTVRLVVQTVTEHGQYGNRFRVDDIHRGVAAVPKYQVSACVLWLKSIGAITGNGHSGYRTNLAELSEKAVLTHWQSLPESE